MPKNFKCAKCKHVEFMYTPDVGSWHQETYVIRCPECGAKEVLTRNLETLTWDRAHVEKAK